MIGIITAIGEEFKAMRSHLTDTKVNSKAGMEFVSGKIDDTPVVLVESGIGKVNAACCAQILVDEYNVTALINVGVGGALAPGLKIGDIVVSTDSFQYDMDATTFGHQVGEIPNLGKIMFEADEALVEAAHEAAKNLGIEYTIGRVATADLGLSDAKIKNWLINEYGAYICDMEGAAIAQVAYLNGVPYLVIRSVSDNADDDAFDSYTNEKENSSLAGAKLAVELIKAI